MMEGDADDKSKTPRTTPSSSTTHVWRAATFIIATEFSERLCSFGVASSLIIYLTKVIHQDLATAAKNVNYWSGATALMPLFGGFVADSYLGQYSTVLISTIIYLFGLVLLSMSWFVPSLKPCANGQTCPKPRKIHELLFFIAIYLICTASGGHKPALQSFGADQFDDDNPKEMKQKMSFFNWWNFSLCSGFLLGVTLIYVQDHVSWGVADITLTAIMLISLLTFVAGKSYYRYGRAPARSSLTPMLRVVVAAFAKRNLPLPSDPSELHQVPKSEMAKGIRLLCHTDKLKLLDKAAVIEFPLEKNPNPWRLATMTEVEEVKLIINMVPIWLTSLAPGMVVAQASTFFIKQATVLDREIVNSFLIPPVTIYAFTAIGMIISVLLYEKILLPTLRRATGNDTGIRVLQRAGIGMTISVITMMVASWVERKRLNIKDHNGSSMSVFWLAPQFLISGFGDGFTLVGLQEYFYSQVPDSMRSIGIAFYLSVLGAGNFLSSLLITVINRMTRTENEDGWIGKDLNRSRLDNFYLVLAGMAVVNFACLCSWRSVILTRTCVRAWWWLRLVMRRFSFNQRCIPLIRNFRPLHA